MGTLLMQYEYQRATAQYNLCERTGIRLNNQLEKYTKRVEKMQSLFSKAESRLENNWNNYSNQFSAFISGEQNNTNGGIGNFIDRIGNIKIGGVLLGQFLDASSIQCNGNDPKEVLSAMATIGAQAKAIMQQLIQNAKEADIEKLHAQQDAQLEPIQEKESDLQGKVACNEALTTTWSERKEAAKSKLGEDIKSGISHYGLS